MTDSITGRRTLMPVTDDQLAALRAQLAGNYAEHKRRLVSLNAENGLDGYTALITAAFVEAVERRFGQGVVDEAAVVEFVGDVRSRFERADEEIDPLAAERIILKARGKGSITDLSGATIRHIERLLLAILVDDEGFNGGELDRFLAEARQLIDG
jgi:hypothetical protein